MCCTTLSPFIQRFIILALPTKYYLAECTVNTIRLPQDKRGEAGEADEIDARDKLVEGRERCGAIRTMSGLSIVRLNKVGLAGLKMTGLNPDSKNYEVMDAGIV